jgi:hypothetical protein
MPSKKPNTFSLFDVAKEKLLSLISDWRTNELSNTVARKLAGQMFQCQDAGGASKFDSWRQGAARDAALLSICAHGAQASVEGCDRDRIYTTPEVANYPEVAGAVIHLVACESLSELAPKLVQPGKAVAVIGYSAPFQLMVPSGQEITEHTATLPEALQITMEFDNQILIALADHHTVQNSIEKAKQWGQDRIASLDAEIARTVDEDRVLELLKARMNLEINAAALGFDGDRDAIVTK